jgi:hypothetical protein
MLTLQDFAPALAAILPMRALSFKDSVRLIVHLPRLMDQGLDSRIFIHAQVWDDKTNGESR